MFYDNFEDGDLAGWTTSGSTSATNEDSYEGTYSAKLKITASMETSVSTSGYTNIHLKYARRTHNLDSGEYLTAEWFDGTDWNTLEQTQEGSWALKDWTLPSGAANNPDFKIRYSVNADKNTEFGFVDIVDVTGTQ